MKLLLPIIKNLIGLILVIALLVVGLYGLKPSNYNDSVQVGLFKFSPFQAGFSLYQDDSPYSYRFSPYNDFVIDSQGNYSALVSKEEIIKDKYQYAIYNNFFDQKISYLLSLINFNHPRLFYHFGSTQFKYSANINQNKITLNQEIINLPHTHPLTATAQTLSYYCNDFIFDQKHNLYTDQAASDIDFFNNHYNFSLNWFNHNLGTNADWEPIPTNSVYLVNHYSPGIIKFETSKNQQLLINRSFCLLAATSPTVNQNNLSNSLTVSLFKNLREAGL